MCLILFAHEAHPDYRLVLAANRDEFYARPTRQAAPWPDAPHVVAGLDLRDGGTWMGVTRGGRWAAVTNFRGPGEARPDAPSRGHLVGDFLRGEASPAEYLRALHPRAAAYSGFNLLVAEGPEVFWYSNRAEHEGERLGPGVYGLSNHLLNTPWPKVERGKRELGRLLGSANGLRPDLLLEVLLDRTYAADHALPDTGVGRDLERALSSLFIASPEYGTRSSTALLVRPDGHALLVERTHEPGGARWSEVRHELPFPA